MSEKVALVVHFLSTFVTAFVIAYVRSWRLALALTSTLPFFSITGAVMNHFMSKYTQLVLSFIRLRIWSNDSLQTFSQVRR